ncbi:hypothetical protein C8R45DRAFT_895968 [Mycena sanguinolenta]|nr:hypothetical protein C8R45DRAFT_895968 [Mycena sanguinolenta]
MSCRSLARQFARKSGSTRHFSAVPKLKSTPVNETLHLVEATASLVSQTIPDSSDSSWNAVLSTALADLRSPHPRPARLVVCGTEGTAARDLVTALLDEPFASNDQARSLRERWAKAPPEQTSLTIEFGNAAADDDPLRLPLAYLNQFPVSLQVIEGTDPALLQTADVPVIVTTLDDLPTLNITRPDTLVVLNIEDTTSQPRASTSRSPAAPRKYLFVSPTQALEALAAVRDAPDANAVAVQRYQTAFLASRMPTLVQALHATLTSLQNPAALRNRTALAQAQGALAACRAAIQDARAEADRVAAGVSALSARIEEERVRAPQDVFGGAEEDNAVDRALVDATAMMKLKIDHMRWRRSIFTIDELTTYLMTTVQRIWCVKLEKELIFHAGRLLTMQRDFTTRAFELLAPSNTRALHSPVLHNALRQLTASPSFPVLPNTLAAPLAARSKLILDAPTARLHVAGQRALFGLGGAVAVGMGTSWAGYLGFLMNADGIAGTLLLEPGTAVATGMLIAVAGVHWSARKWNKARQRWWDDFTRVAGGLKQDIMDTLDQTMETQVLVVARTGCEELSKRLGERKIELDVLQERLDALSSAADQLEQRK